MINLGEVGAHPAKAADGTWSVQIGVYLPGLRYPDGCGVRVFVIHELDQFIRDIPPNSYDLYWQGGDLDLWNVTIPLAGGPGHFGTRGRYLYRFALLRGGDVVTLSFTDPFAIEAGTGNLSVFTADDSVPFAWTDAAFKPSALDDLVVYELHVGEFNNDFDGVIDQLDYLVGLGVNVLELMPLTNVKEVVEWGYTPLDFFAPNARYGGSDGLRRLVDAAHAKGVAVILDAVYAHAHPDFAYNRVYADAGAPNPMMGVFMGEFFSQPGTDYRKAFTRDYFLTVNRFWIEEYHVDGFRYDYVPGYYDGPAGDGYADLVYQTHQLAAAIPRFQGADGTSLLIQCAENLPDAPGILSQTYSNCCWQNGLLDLAASAAWGGSITNLAHQFDPGLEGYPTLYTNAATGESFPVAPFQYIESHDNSSFLSRIDPGSSNDDDLLGNALGNREHAYRMQPYVIGLYAAKGIPMLCQGQEFGENWSIPSWGIGRNLFGRPLHWEYFYDEHGRALVRLHRVLGTLRRSLRCLGARGPFYYFDMQDHRDRGVIAFRRWVDADGALPEQQAIILLNLWNDDAEVWLPFPRAGIWQEQIDRAVTPRPDISIDRDGAWSAVRVPSNYGCIYLLQ